MGFNSGFKGLIVYHYTVSQIMLSYGINCIYFMYCNLMPYCRNCSHW